MFHFRKAALGLVAGASMVGSASAQDLVGIGVNNTAIGVIGNAVASVVSRHSDLQMRPQTVASTSMYVPMVNDHELEFGVANAMQTVFSIEGRGFSEGRPNPNLRIVATLFPTYYSPIVRADSDIVDTADIEGIRVPSGWASVPVGEYLMGAYLRNADLTWDDVEQVPVAGFDQAEQAFIEGRTDITLAIVGDPVEINAQVPIRHLNLDDSEEAVERMQEMVPGSYISVIEPAEGRVGVEQPINVMTQDFVLFAHDEVPDEVVYEVVSAIYENIEEMRETSPMMGQMAQESLANDIGQEYHPGARRFYEEMGVFHGG